MCRDPGRTKRRSVSPRRSTPASSTSRFVNSSRPIYSYLILRAIRFARIARFSLRDRIYPIYPGISHKNHIHVHFRAHLGFPELGQVWTDVKSDTLHSAGQRNAANQQDSEQHVGEKGGKVDNFAGPFDAFPDAEVTEYPY